MTHNVWSGFFNPSFWPSLLYRTVAAMAIAALAACVVINVASALEREARRELIGHASVFLAPMVLMPFLGGWFLASMPADSRSWVLGGSVTMTMFMGIGVGASLLIGAYALGALLVLKLYINGFTAALLCAIALAATAGGEFVREGVRKPYSIRQVLYSNSIRPDELERLRKTGSVTEDPYPLRDGLDYPNDQLKTGAKVLPLPVQRLPHLRRGQRLARADWDLDSRSEADEYRAIAADQAIHAPVRGSSSRSGGLGAALELAARGDAADLAGLERSRHARADPGLARRGGHDAGHGADGTEESRCSRITDWRRPPARPQRSGVDGHPFPVRLSLADGHVPDPVRRHGGDLHGLHELRDGRSDRALGRLSVPGARRRVEGEPAARLDQDWV